MAYYANEVLNIIDPSNEMISYRLFNEHCYRTSSGHFIKDLRIIKNRDLANVVLVDNAAYSYAMQTDNGLPIAPFFDDRRDSELADLGPYLSALALAPDVRPVLARHFHESLFRRLCNDPVALRAEIGRLRSTSTC